MNIRAIIWDWGRTLYESDQKVELPEAEEVLKYCKLKGYRMAAVSKAGTKTLTDAPSTVDVPERYEQMERSPLRKFFEAVYVTDQDKSEFFDRAAADLNLPRGQILLVGDRVKREIAYANLHGHPSIWIQRGKFAHEIPDEETGQPTYTVKSLSEIIKII